MNMLKKKSVRKLAIVILLYCVVVFFRLGSFTPAPADSFDESKGGQNTYISYGAPIFDEMIYAPASFGLWHGEYVSETTHPPLGKILIGLGIQIFGMVPFGWRITCALCGIAMLPVCYLIVKDLTDGREDAALITTILLSMESMHFTLSRTGTIDNVVAFFIMILFWMLENYLRRTRRSGNLLQNWRWLIGCGIMIGLAAATKWTGVYAAAGSIVLLLLFYGYLRHKKRAVVTKHLQFIVVLLISFVILPAAIYILSFLPVAGTANPVVLIQTTVEKSREMLYFHEHAMQSHPFASRWYSWMWLIRPLLDISVPLGNGRSSSVVTMGNPVIWWGGIAALGYCVYRLLCKKDFKAGYLCAAYVMMLLPWTVIGRTTFIYQYYVCALVMVMMIGYCYSFLGENGREAMTWFTEAAGIVFALFYPVLSGLPISSTYVVRFLEWLPTWTLL